MWIVDKCNDKTVGLTCTEHGAVQPIGDECPECRENDREAQNDLDRIDHGRTLREAP